MSDQAFRSGMLAQELFDLRKFTWQDGALKKQGNRLRMNESEWGELNLDATYANRNGRPHYGKSKPTSVYGAELILAVDTCPNGLELLALEADRFLAPVRRFAAGTGGSAEESRIDYDAATSFARMVRLLTVLVLTGLTLQRTQELFWWPRMNERPLHRMSGNQYGLFGRETHAATNILHELPPFAHKGLFETVTNALLGNDKYCMPSKGIATDKAALNEMCLFIPEADDMAEHLECLESEFKDAITELTSAVFCHLDQVLQWLLTGKTEQDRIGKYAEDVLAKLHTVMAYMRSMMAAMADGVDDLVDSTLYNGGGISIGYACNLAHAAMFDRIPAVMGDLNGYRAMMEFPWPAASRAEAA